MKGLEVVQREREHGWAKACSSTLTYLRNSQRWQTRTLQPPSPSCRPRSPRSSKPSTRCSQLRSSNTSNRPPPQTRPSPKPGLTYSRAMSCTTSYGVSLATLYLDWLPRTDTRNSPPSQSTSRRPESNPLPTPSCRSLCVLRPWYALAGCQLTDLSPRCTQERLKGYFGKLKAAQNGQSTTTSSNKPDRRAYWRRTSQSLTLLLGCLG